MLRRHSVPAAIAAVALLGSIAFTPRIASAIGYYNVPGSFYQCFGYGNGAGHQACLVLGPSSCHGFCDTHEVRVECPPQPPYSYYSYGGYGPPVEGSWLHEQVPVQVAPQPAPTPAAMRPRVHRQPTVW
jgi:hypothetical protein